ncbi:P-loop NTPase fold protein [Pseudoalteromonas sp. APC 3358]|uniref:KAP family P-loop NTPase fold protein n=1 Tax=Pseudoalteromonas sp. APC 3358 TaxID=3035176 RepID=UPI0025B43E67|nr:P-loop NTPase fold protein [Pseudoalteromonas sp. APC 3358]MDN3382781.1 P-loop NTPase fold protein [Pseudoalteromonas sp. APC 3358]
MKMDFDWSKIKVIDGEQFSSDNLDRAKYATYLTSLIKEKGGTDKSNLSNYVLNLDAEWGAGKTYFLKRWSEDLKGNHPVVYIDAWAIDYLESPLMTVLSEIIEQLKQLTNKIDPDETKRKLNEVVKAAAPRIGSALMKRYLGFDFNIFESTEEGEQQTSNDSKNVDFSKAGERVLEIFCKEVTDSKESVKTLKEAIQRWVEYVVNTPIEGMETITNSFPAFIFIDELDRCKPTYAVEMLEAIKHVFDIPGLVFIVATNTSQLSHTIKAVYGADFNAEEYLSRFFDNKYILRNKISPALLHNHCNSSAFSQEFLVGRQVIIFPFIYFSVDNFFDLCCDVFCALKLSPRQSIKILNRLELIVSNINSKATIDGPFLVILLALMEKNIKLYEEFLDYFILNKKIDNGTCPEFSLYSKLLNIQIPVSIRYDRDRLLYESVDDSSLPYETSDSPNESKSYEHKSSLCNYLNSFGDYYRQTSDTDVLGKKYRLLCDTISGNSRVGLNTTYLRFTLSFLIFNNTLNLDSYRELAEISASLD